MMTTNPNKGTEMEKNAYEKKWNAIFEKVKKENKKSGMDLWVALTLTDFKHDVFLPALKEKGIVGMEKKAGQRDLMIMVMKLLNGEKIK